MSRSEDQLEAMVDAHGLRSVLLSLAAVCGDKADHIASNWQDRALARRWLAAARALEKFARSAKMGIR